MLRRFLRYAALSTALFYNACIPPEEDLESQCEGEVLFEDEFEGSELDEGKWDREPCGRDYYSLNNGVLEFRVERGGCGLQSRPTYTLDERTLCFEARWKVREREGTGLQIGLQNENYDAISFEAGFGHNYLDCGTGVSMKLDTNRCDVDITRWHTTKFETNNQRANFYIDGKLKSTSTLIPPENNPLLIDVTCASEDDKEKKCYIEHIKMSK